MNHLNRCHDLRRRFTLPLHLFLAAVFLLFLGPTLGSAQHNTPRRDTWVTDGSVSDIACTSSTIYIGGQFNCVGPYTGCGVPVDKSTGRATAVFDRLEGEIFRCVSDGSGGWYVARSTSKGSLFASQLAHIFPDGRVDSNWNPQISGIVTGIALSGRIIYIGGHFPVGTKSRVMYALDAATGTVTDWNPDISWANPLGSVSAIVPAGSNVYIGGNFTAVGGKPRNCLAAIDATTGNVTDWNPTIAGDSTSTAH